MIKCSRCGKTIELGENYLPRLLICAHCVKNSDSPLADLFIVDNRCLKTMPGYRKEYFSICKMKTIKDECEQCQYRFECYTTRRQNA